MILASASPRREELLRRAGFQLTIHPADIDESQCEGESPIHLVERLATQKAHAVIRELGELPANETLLAADTIVWLDNDILGKPRDTQDAVRMLRELSGNTHHVSTGVCMVRNGSQHGLVKRSFVETTTVSFRELSDEQILSYVQTKEPMDKAGAYAIQGGAAAFVECMQGDYDNVVGLPISRVVKELDTMKADGVRSITQIPGVFAAHYTNAKGATGCTVIVCPKGATGAVDVRGGAPATRETDLLRPEETVGVLHAVVLSGGSAFGLAAGCGVAEELERSSIGLDVGVGLVPIVSQACLFDLAVGDSKCRPTAEDGAHAASLALAEADVDPLFRSPLERGNVGAGTGCSVGKYGGPQRSMKAGFGECVRQSGPLVCGAVAAVNAVGNIVDPSTRKPLAGMLTEDFQDIQGAEQALLASAASISELSTEDRHQRTNTTISCVVTNARLTKAQATKVAQMAADAYAHAISPTHTTNDGDTVFVMATGEVESQPDTVGTLATQALREAIADAARSATSAYGLIAARDLPAGDIHVRSE